MNQAERRIYLIAALLAERPEYRHMRTRQMGNAADDKALLRALLNVRMPGEADPEFLAVQDAYLQEETRQKGIVELRDLTPVQDGIYLWQGDITRLACDAIVNAANSAMTGCYAPNHSCIDNCIHTYAGVQLRLACARIIEAQGHEEPTGRAQITPAYNLPCRYVLHTVGPIVNGPLTREHERLLASCYRSCLDLAAVNGLQSIAFCCISTGVFRFPNMRAAEIAVRTAREWRQETGSTIKVIYNVYKDEDKAIYERILGDLTE